MKKNIMLLLLFVVIIFSQQTIIAQVKQRFMQMEFRKN
jgi:hypothetical protein